MRRFLSFFRNNRDWAAILIVASVLLLVSVLTYFAIFHNLGKTATESRGNKFTPVTYEIIPPDPKYPPPAKEQLAFSQFITVDDVTFDLFWANRNVNRDKAVGSHSFTLTVRNNKNAVYTLSPNTMRQVTVGCIAIEVPYQAQAVSPMEPLTLQPYEKRETSFGIDVSCLYLGTADGKYFWRIY